MQMLGQYGKITTRVWEIYHSDDKNTFSQGITGFKEWAIEKMPKGNGVDAVLKLCNKAPEFVKAYDPP
ncbi:hypothetical protein DRO03_05220 [Methanosarcinales archaeon]|nr:MAG: hypothetical protein DRO03_05220 [Methanosarcinales archaeon]